VSLKWKGAASAENNPTCEWTAPLSLPAPPLPKQHTSAVVLAERHHGDGGRRPGRPLTSSARRKQGSPAGLVVIMPERCTPVQGQQREAGAVVQVQHTAGASRVERRRQFSVGTSATAGRPRSRRDEESVSAVELAAVARADLPWPRHEGECSGSWASKLGLGSLRRNPLQISTRTLTVRRDRCRARGGTAGMALARSQPALGNTSTKLPVGALHQD
jgi:hypothetical protein